MGVPGSSEVAQARREQILTAAVEVFGAQGFAAASIKDVAAAAGVSTALLYHYFDSKQAILAEAARTQSLLPQLDGVLAEAEAMSVRDALVLAARRFVGVLRLREAMVRVLVSESRTAPEVGQVWRELIQAASARLGAWLATRVEAGQMRPIEPEMLFRALVSPLLVATLHGLDPEPWIDDLVDLLLRGALPRDDDGGGA